MKRGQGRWGRTGKSLQSRMVSILLTVLLVLLLCQTVVLSALLIHNQRGRHAYIESMTVSAGKSLESVGQNLESIGSFISTYPAFQELYITRTRSAQAYAEASHTVRFMTMYIPIVKEVIVVDLGGIATGYYAPDNYDIVDKVIQRYPVFDAAYVQSEFLFFDREETFAYVVPISKNYSSTTPVDKEATAIFLCDIAYLYPGTETEEEQVLLDIVDTEGHVITETVPAGAGTGEGVQRVPVSEYFAKPMGLTVRAYGSSNGNNELMAQLLGFFAASSLVIVVSMAVILLRINHTLIRPIANLAEEIKDEEKQYIGRRIPGIEISEINLITDSFNRLLEANEDTTRKILRTQVRLYESELRETKTEFYALQSQVNPHFLYNTLQCVRSLALMEHVPDIADIALAMSDLFRYSIEGAEQVRLKEELAIVEKYEQISRIRFQGKFRFVHEVDEGLQDCFTMKMLIQPLVENAVFHGVSKLAEGGVVVLRIRRVSNELEISVVDNGPRFSETRIQDIQAVLAQDFSTNLVQAKGKYLGLYNIHRRIKLHYGPSYGLAIQRTDGQTTVGFRFPMVKGQESPEGPPSAEESQPEEK